MFFFLSKILDLLFAPLTWALILVALGAVKAPRVRRYSRFAPALAIAILFVFSLEPVSNALERSLEEPRVSTFSPATTYDAVVLLGGFVDARASASANEPAYQDGIERLLVTYDLLRSGQAKKVIVSTGDVDSVGATWTEARAVAAQLKSWGIAEDRILVEDKSLNTRQNALFSADIVRAQGLSKLLLVTSAFHMKRALGCFEAVGLHPDTRPTDFRTYAGAPHVEWLPRATHLANSTSAIREHVGRIVYRWRGYSTR
jgi:uncharacterized SAM-binding protein YcdF (DUF218 family)